MANPWLRLYAEFATDPKVQMMSEAYQRRYLMILCLRCSNGPVTLHDAEVAFQLRITNDEWMATKAVFLQKNLIGEDNLPTSWDRRQFSSDSSAARVAAHREREKTACNADVTLQKQRSNVTVTPPDTDTDTDTEAEADQKQPPLPLAKKRGNRQDREAAANAADTFKANAFLIACGADPQTAADYLTMRRLRKAPATLTALSKLKSEADLSPMNFQSVLELCCSRGWIGFKADWASAQDARVSHRQTLDEQRKATLDELTGRTRNGIPQQPTEPRDITGESWLIA
jgi:hypothetical protein